jgi:transcriptional regulator with PAS, ATPase and Fis domain
MQENNRHGAIQEMLIGSSSIMHDLYTKILSASQSSKSTVLITGESGTGKELVARAIHNCSSRAREQYIPFNCTTTPQDLIESRLFGHKKGAYTGAISDDIGMIRFADGGTFFLDEVGDLPIYLQPKLLRFLQEGEVHTLGEHVPRRVDVRIIAATNKCLEEEVAAQRFRGDLYYRLNVIHIEVPSLRERRSDIPKLVEHFCKKLPARLHRSTPIEFEDRALELFYRFATEYQWPGNVRELENMLEALATTINHKEVITYDQVLRAAERKRKFYVHIQVQRQHGSRVIAEDKKLLFPLPEPILGIPEDGDLDSFVSGIVKKIIDRAIEVKGSKTAAARALGIDRSTLNRKLESAERVLQLHEPKEN